MISQYDTGLIILALTIATHTRTFATNTTFRLIQNFSKFPRNCSNSRLVKDMPALKKYLKYVITGLFIRAAATITRLPCQTSAHFSIILNGMADNGVVANTTVANTARQCTLSCASLPLCKSLNYIKNKRQCELLNRSLNESKFLLQQQSDSVYMTTDEFALTVGIIT